MKDFFNPEKWAELWQYISNPEDMLFATWETLYVTLLTTLFAVIIGLPLGVVLATGDKGGVIRVPRFILNALNIVINILRSVPFLILMILVIPLTQLIMGTSIGTSASIVPLTIASFPFVARLVEGSLREVNPNIIEAAQSMGASPSRIIWGVMIPESVPSLISNLTIALTTILGYTAMSCVLGGGGLGKMAYNYGYIRYKTLILFFSVVILVLLVQIFQSIGTRLSFKLDKRIKHK